jgi:DNA-binding MarR family transcriptional regulator
MTNNHIAAMRSFNRFYTVLIGVLNKKFLNTRYSLPELRVLQAIHFLDGITASEIIAVLHIDKSYLSRIILQFEKRKLIVKKNSPNDGRAFHLHLTAAGKKEFEIHDAVTHNQVQQILSQLSGKDCEKLIHCMGQIKEILSKPAL